MKYIRLITIILACAALVMLAFFNQATVQPEDLDPGRVEPMVIIKTVEVPMVVTLIELVELPPEIVEIEVPKEVVRVETKIVEVYPPDDTGFFPWESRQEIKDYIKSTGIPDREYDKDVYDCSSFAIDLVLQAKRDNRFIGLLGIYRYNTDGTVRHHWKCFAVKGLDIYEIEPKTANIWILQGFEMARVD